MPAPRPPARLAAVEPAPVRSLEHSHSGNRPVAPSFERGPLACSLALPCVVFAGVIDLVSILGLFFNLIHMPLCSTMNKMVTIDVLDDQMRLALQAVAHNVLAEPRGIILLTLSGSFPSQPKRVVGGGKAKWAWYTSYMYTSI